MKGYRAYIIIIIVLFTGLVVVEYNKPKPINWDKTYINKDKIPYGTYVLYDVLTDIFPGQKIHAIRKPVYNYLADYYYYQSNDSGLNMLKSHSAQRYNYIFINNKFSIDMLDLTYLLQFVEDGSKVFIASTDLKSPLLDTLKLDVGYDGEIRNDSVSISFVNADLNPGYKIKRNDAEFFFKSKDTLKDGTFEMLAGIDADRPVFIRKQYGKGYFYLCSTPVLFSNLFLLSEKINDFSYKALSYLPLEPVFWDEYQKQGSEGEDSLFRALFAYQSLRWAYYITLALVVLFVFFEAKRRQRIIPIIKPLPNSTLEFTRTLGNLYLSKGDHKNIALKKIQYFFDFVRERYRISTNDINDELVKAIAEKSGLEKTIIDDIIRMINFVQYNVYINEKNLLDFNSLLERFYRSAT